MKLLKNVTGAAHLIYFMTIIYFIKSPNFNSKSTLKASPLFEVRT